MNRFGITNLKIRNKLLLIYFLCVLLPIILTDVIIIFTVNDGVIKDNRKSLQYLMERIEYNLNETIKGSVMFANNLYRDRYLNEVLNYQYRSAVEFYDEYYTLIRNNNINNSYSNSILTRVQIYTDNNTVLTGGKLAALDNVRESGWYKEYENYNRKTILYIYYDGTKPNLSENVTRRTFSIISPLDYFLNVGIEKLIKIDISYNIMLQDVINERTDADVYIRNKDYILFCNHTTDNGMSEFAAADSIAVNEQTMYSKFDCINQEFEIVVVPKELNLWTILLENKGMILLIILDIILPSALILVVGKSINRRISLVVTHMDRVKREEFEEITSYSGEDEIGDLIRSYNMMTQKIRNLIQVVFKEQTEKQALELSRKSAELKAIQSQVNPHVFFNTLESIRMRSLIKGEEETADIIGEMALLFRKSMMWGSDFITIEEELSFVEKYVKIQSYRFGDKITFDHYVSDCCKQYMVPKLAISTFVENACVHGIEASAEKGVISLNITQYKKYLYIEIADNGKGVEKAQLEELRHMIANADAGMLSEVKSTGMLNAFLRLKMYFEEEVTFTIDSTSESGTDITIQIPLDKIKVSAGGKAEND